MSDVVLSPKDKLAIAEYEDSPLMRILRRHQTQKYSIGDVLIRFKFDEDGKRSSCTVSKGNLMPRKYKVVHINDLGVSFVKYIPYSEDADPESGALVSMLHTDVQAHEFQVDPDFTDSIIFGTEYTPYSEEMRKKVTEIRNFNKAIFKTYEDYEEFSTFAEALMPGQTFWHGEIDHYNSVVVKQVHTFPNKTAAKKWGNTAANSYGSLFWEMDRIAMNTPRGKPIIVVESEDGDIFGFSSPGWIDYALQEPKKNLYE
jgi:hypothetical protein